MREDLDRLLTSTSFTSSYTPLEQPNQPIRQERQLPPGLFPKTGYIHSPKPSFMEKPQITAYLKTSCGWSRGVRAVLAKYDLPYTEKDIIINPAFRWEMEQRSGQPLSPCVEVNGVMLPDISGEEVEAYLLKEGLVGSSDRETNVPLNSACTDAEHAAMRAGEPINFKQS
jgi:glutaredoxin